MEYFWCICNCESGNPTTLFDYMIKQLIHHFRSGIDENICQVFLVLTSTVEFKAGRNVIDDNIGRIIVRGCGNKTLEVGVANKWKRMNLANTTPFQMSSRWFRELGCSPQISDHLQHYSAV